MTEPRTLVCAHRGASAYRADNSEEAFRQAIEMGAEMLEADLRRTADGRLVLAHDPLPGPAPSGLLELSDLVRLAERRIAINLELKEAGYEDEVLACLQPRPSGLIVTSFLPAALSAIHELDPSVRTGLVIGRRFGRSELLARADACGASALVAHISLLDSELRRRVLAAGRMLMVWTVNDPAVLEKVLGDPAVRCVITDVPDVALAVRNRLSAPNGADRREGS
jgi:glycerophosphoryl diester phosphodiesterase